MKKKASTKCQIDERYFLLNTQLSEYLITPDPLEDRSISISKVFIVLFLVGGRTSLYSEAGERNQSHIQHPISFTFNTEQSNCSLGGYATPAPIYLNLIHNEKTEVFRTYRQRIANAQRTVSGLDINVSILLKINTFSLLMFM